MRPGLSSRGNSAGRHRRAVPTRGRLNYFPVNALRDRIPPFRLLQQWIRDGFRVLFTRGPRALGRAVYGVYKREFRGEGREVTPHAVGAAVAAAPTDPGYPPMLCWLLEVPDVTVTAADPETFEVRGWIAAAGAIRSIAFADERCRRLLPLALSQRPDVTAVYGLPATGFSASCRYDDVRDLGIASLRFEVDGREHEIVVPVYRTSTDRAALKAAKLERVAAIAQCPACGARAFEREPQALRCGGCGAAYPRSEARIDFLTPELRAAFDIVPTSNVSANVYDGEALNILHRQRDGLVLDCGAGLRERYYANVVNYEIVAYDSTDVLGVGEKLPFADASFDAVFSFAVLEHVKDPFACSRELLRVLRPGGTLYCQVPFLQPVHGYPHHYHNMTTTGLRGLFGDAIRVETAGPFLFGQPVFALSWMLNRYVEGLPAAERDAFRSMTVEQLLQPGSRYLGAPFVTQLAPDSREELSCCNLLIGTKVDGAAR
jgi:SAM-dependent methyltransferase